MTTLLLAIGVFYAAFTATLFFSQDRLLFLPHIPGRKIEATPADIGLEYAPLTLNTEDGIQLNAWFIPSSKTKATVLFFHGNAGNISHRLDSIRILHSLGLSVFIFDYRGYGRSTGKPSEEGVYQDAQTAWHYLIKVRRIDPNRIILFGRSLGGAIAAWLSCRTQAGAVIIESTFTSIPDLAAGLYPLLPVRLLARLDFNTLNAMSSIHSPVLISHSKNDEIIPFSHGKAIYEAANPPKQFLQLQGGHNDGFIVTGQRYSQNIEIFLRQHLSDFSTQ
jgi:fermentation-respiration switch protein FrsA (DUF1100 family)